MSEREQLSPIVMLAEILRKAQNHFDAETGQRIDIGYECMALRRHIDLAAERELELVEALRPFRHKRHRHISVEVDSVGDACAVCGKDLRHDIHYRAGESEATDRQFARDALAQTEPKDES